jgi:hypothetical protein
LKSDPAGEGIPRFQDIAAQWHGSQPTRMNGILSKSISNLHRKSCQLIVLATLG